MIGRDDTFTIDSIHNVIVWRVIASHYRLGHWEYLYDDYVLTPKLPEYLTILTERGAQRITLKRLGPFSNVLMNDREHLASAGSIAKEKKNTKLTEWSDIPSETEYQKMIQ